MILFLLYDNRSITNEHTLGVEHILGLCINLANSTLVGINMAEDEVKNLAEVIGCSKLA